MAENRLPLIEPAVILDTFVSGIGDVEEVAPGLCRVTYYAKQKDVCSGEPSLVVVAKFIVTKETIADMEAIGWAYGDDLRQKLGWNVHPRDRGTSN